MKKEMVIVGLWVLAFLSAGTCIAITSIRSTYNDKILRLTRIPSAQQLILPHPITPPGNTGDLAAIRRFLQQMDSLRLDSTGRQRYDSICFFRPGLIDSARAAEKLYNLFNTLK